MRNEYMSPAEDLSLPVPAGTRAGDPVKVGALCGVAATNVGEGGNPAGCATVLSDSRLYEYEVAGGISGPCVPVWLTPRAGAAAPVLSTTGAGPHWGYTVPRVGESGVRAATSGVVAVRPRQVLAG